MSSPARPILGLVVASLGLSSMACALDVTLTAAAADSAADEVGTEDEGDEASDDEVGTDSSDTDEGGSSTDGEDEGETGRAMPNPLCQVVPGELDAPLPCDMPYAAVSLEPEVQWTWSGNGFEDSVVTTPLVANLDDDNGDGFIDLCDTPDVLVAAIDLPAEKQAVWPKAHLTVIDGATGETSRVFAHGIDGAVNPAIADLDNDGSPEILALEQYGTNSPYQFADRHLVAFDAEGNLKWSGEYVAQSRGGGAIAVADLDHDGSPEILAPEYVTDANGQLLWALDDPPTQYSMPVAADFDLDGNLEVLFGGTAYHHDGSLYFDVQGAPTNRGSAAVANFDDDPNPEFYAQHDGAHAVFDHDGSLIAVCPAHLVMGEAGNPTSIGDLNGDGKAEILFAIGQKVYALRPNADSCTIAWEKNIDTPGAKGAATVFDLLTDGGAEVLYADDSQMRLYDQMGNVVASLPRTARENIASPVVADIDGDGGADMLFASSQPVSSVGEPELPGTAALTMVSNGQGAFAPTRRIWNQHAYRGETIREDGRVSSYEADFEPGNWMDHNGYRANPGVVGFEQCAPGG